MVLKIEYSFYKNIINLKILYNSFISLSVLFLITDCYAHQFSIRTTDSEQFQCDLNVESKQKFWGPSISYRKHVSNRMCLTTRENNLGKHSIFVTFLRSKSNSFARIAVCFAIFRYLYYGSPAILCYHLRASIKPNCIPN